jgi:beta-N-acetylhexosaminidase
MKANMQQNAPKLGPIVIDIVGKELGADDVRRILHPMTGGVILFGRNFEARQQISALIQAIRALRPNLLISVDHEGGRVQRFKTDGFTHLPAMRTLGQMYAHNPAQGLQTTHAAGFILGAELRAVGVDYSYTPVLDLDYGDSSVIGDRSFSDDAQTVSALAQALNAGLRQAGMGNCGKHFPGHGFVAADSHVAMPVDERELADIMSADILPYQQLTHDLSAIMPAHVIYPKVDAQPAGFSKIWLDLLREQLGFTGAIITDDLSMVGAAGMIPNVVQRVQAALDAGCDQVLLCNRPDDLDQALHGLPERYLNQTHQVRLQTLYGSQRPDWAALQGQAIYQTALEQIKPLLQAGSGADPTAVMLQKSMV